MLGFLQISLSSFHSIIPFGFTLLLTFFLVNFSYDFRELGNVKRVNREHMNLLPILHVQLTNIDSINAIQGKYLLGFLLHRILTIAVRIISLVVVVLSLSVTPMFPPVCKYNYMGQETMENSICVNV